ncbi:MAG: ribosomal protein methyltransferase PrmA [Actinomycetota bacterium]
MSDQWFTLVVHVPHIEREAFTAQLWDCEIGGFEERDHEEFVEFRIGTTNPNGVQSISAPEWFCSCEPIAATTGLDTWREFAKVERAGRCVIVPSWHEYQPEPDEIVVVIDPQYSFGSGSHPTTRLCAELLSEYVQNTDTVADIGCGSGVLSVVAAKAGAALVCATDIDPHACAMTVENAQRNDVVIEVAPSIDDFSLAQFEIVVANIGAAVLCELAPTLLRATKKFLLVSGLLIEQQNDVIDCFVSSDVALRAVRQLDEWSAVIFEKVIHD